ncbi:MAG: SH3 domain-containing protein [Syntrophobacteria bacterium]
MNKFEELNYYEILEIPVNASSFEIRRAYRNAVEVYSDHSLLTYSLFSAEERVNILKKLEDAYNTLIDRAKRIAYDASLSDKSSNTDIPQDHKLPLLGHNGRHKRDFIRDENGAWLVAGTASENISAETRSERSLTSIDSGAQKSLHEKTVEIEDLGLTRSFWGQISCKMIVIISLLGLILIALSSILGPSDLLNWYYLPFTRGENHAEAKAKQAQVEETDFGDQKDKIKEEPENLDDKALIAPESISSTEDLPEVYENIAPLANIRERPTIDSRIIAKIHRGKEVSVVGKDSEWVMLKLDNDSIGWIHRSLIRKTPTNTDSSEVDQ